MLISVTWCQDSAVFIIQSSSPSSENFLTVAASPSPDDHKEGLRKKAATADSNDDGAAAFKVSVRPGQHIVGRVAEVSV